jgi:hypothetical protein
MSQLFTDLPVMPAPVKPVQPPRPRPSRAKTKRMMPTFGVVITDPDEHRAQIARRPRKCLSCGDMFPSEHAGNRVCAGCKALVAWGTPNDCSLATTASF